MQCLVSGGSGFLGSHLIEALVKRGEQVRALVRPDSKTEHLNQLGIELSPGDLGDVHSLKNAVQNIDMVYHCAALAADWGSWKDFENTNVVGTRNLLQASLERGVDKFIHIKIGKQTKAIDRYSCLWGQFNEEFLYSQLPRFSGIPDERFYQVYP